MRVRGGRRFATTMKGKEPRSFLVDGGYATEAGLSAWPCRATRGFLQGQQRQVPAALNGGWHPLRPLFAMPPIPHRHRRHLPYPPSSLAGFVSAQRLPVNGGFVFN